MTPKLKECRIIDGVNLPAITPTGSGKTNYYTMYTLVVLAVYNPLPCPTTKSPKNPSLFERDDGPRERTATSRQTSGSTTRLTLQLQANLWSSKTVGILLRSRIHESRLHSGLKGGTRAANAVIQVTVFVKSL